MGEFENDKWVRLVIFNFKDFKTADPPLSDFGAASLGTRKFEIGWVGANLKERGSAARNCRCAERLRISLGSGKASVAAAHRAALRYLN